MKMSKAILMVAWVVTRFGSLLAVRRSDTANNEKNDGYFLWTDD
jgi:hypothetical protein